MQGKRTDLPDAARIDTDVEVVGAYDDVGELPSYIVADISRDDAWLAIAAEGAMDLVTHR